MNLKLEGTCGVGVVRRGALVECGKVAVAVGVDRDRDSTWPVCAFHARGDRILPLAELLALAGA